MAQKTKKRIFHLRRVGLFGLLLAAFFIVRLDAGGVPKPLRHVHVLSYASEMSQSGLLAGTNAARAANGLPSLSLNGQLNSSAQMKAQDMANKDYWAHVAPDGTQPWYFFNQAGYAYIRAGENLAYGFSTSQGAVDGWMNSASHRANILGDYYDVGFGIVNSASYQSNGEQTIVVAHYGSKTTVAAAPAPTAPIAPAPSTPATPSPTITEAVPTPTPAPEIVQPESVKPTDPNPPSETTAKPIPQATQVQTGDESRISVLSMMRSKNLPAAALLSLVMVSFAVVGYALTHRAAFQHAVTAGEHFVVKHPGIDTGVIAALTSLILLTTYGTIR